ncbi:hypothetical protein AKJ09_10340 [Labilithrix luteola]|uniref:Uncharacterized protein n=1 Tax=Labilithrix luteola TaxID=1391654 RepID=A0A0K1QDC8_9BACT|nr:hypothetical protein [Labilithrix luteola]AKV03677.1 hypothetical protein AKJ09_10340 [Labilithrix luteola]
MIIVYGTRMYGKVKACGASFLATQFFHIWYLPLFPVGSKLVLEEAQDGTFHGVSAPFSFKSVMAAYLRVWGPIGILIAILCGLDVLGAADNGLALLLVIGFTGIVILALLVSTILAYAVIGKLSEDEKRKRAAYAMHSGYFVDPADMGEAKAGMREMLLGRIAERARGLASMGYRLNADPMYAWPHVALDPTHNDDALVTAAFTLARLEATVDGPQKIHMEQLHAQLWNRIQQMNPPYLQAHARLT